MHERVENEKKLIKVNSFPFDKVYFGMPQYTGKTMKLNRPLFVTPYKGIASIFAVSRNEKIRSIIRGSGYKNLGYDEWGLPKSQLQDYLTELHVQVQGGKDFSEQTFDLSGYVYEIDVSKLKDNIYQHPWMTKDKEFLIADIDEVKFSSIRKVNIKTYVKHYDSKPIKESYQIEGDKMKHDGFEEIRALLTGEEFIEESTSRSLKEVKKHQNQQKEIKNKNANKSLEQSIRQCFYKRGDSYHFEICPDDFEGNKQVLAFINKLEQFLNTKSNEDLNDIHTKTKLFKMLTLVKGRWDPSVYAVYNMNDLMEGVHLKFFPMSTKLNIFNKTGYRFFHLDKSGILTTLKPRESTSHDGGRAVYNQKSIFFYAIREDKLDDIFVKFIKQNDTVDKKDQILKIYGKCIYEYKPKSNDIFYVDNIDGIGERRTKNYLPESTPVFINTETELPVTRVDKNIVTRLLKSKKLISNKSEEHVNRWMNKYPAYESYIDETIERFDAFMEEFNNGQVGNSEFIMESVQDNEYAKITAKYIKDSGRLSLRYKKGEDDLPQEVVDRIVYLCNKLLNFPTTGNYNQYKTYYDALCKIVHHPNNTNISYNVIDKAVNQGYINFGTNAGGKRLPKRCKLKPGTRLYHTSDNGNLSILKPTVFIGEDVFYAAPRIYFYCEAIGSRYGGLKTVKYDVNNKPIITDDVRREFKHVYMYIVKPGDTIYFDPELNGEHKINGGAMYLTYTKPIKLIKIY